jgi:predicted GIY-YIG superfamily endonuclease
VSEYIVYGLRLKGDREVRYVGVTRRGLKFRLQKHVYGAKGRYPQTPLCRWLVQHRADVEIFSVHETDNRGEAFRRERQMIEMATSLGQRLFNQTHVPYALRLVA